MPPSLPSWLPYATLTIAVIGAVLGVLNTWRLFLGDRVRLKVDAIFAYIDDESVSPAGIQVVNLSSFPVTISWVGYVTRERKGWWPLRRRQTWIVKNPSFYGSNRLPMKLQPRELGVFVFQEKKPEMKSPIVGVYASTQCSVIRFHMRRKLEGELARHFAKKQ